MAEALPADPAISRKSLSEKAAVDVVRFGDGHALDTPAGINNIRREYRVEWDVLTRAESDLLIGFFRARRGVERIAWTPHGDVAGEWVCATWSRTWIAGGARANVRATLEERF